MLNNEGDLKGVGGKDKDLKEITSNNTEELRNKMVEEYKKLPRINWIQTPTIAFCEETKNLFQLYINDYNQRMWKSVPTLKSLKLPTDFINNKKFT